MTEDETAVREALAKMTPGEWRVVVTSTIVNQIETVLPCGGLDCVSVEAGEDDDAAGIVALKNHTPALLAELDAARAEVERLREALGRSDAAMREYYRYWTGGETRGSYDGKPERAALWDAMWKNRAALEPRP